MSKKVYSLSAECDDAGAGERRHGIERNNID